MSHTSWKRIGDSDPFEPRDNGRACSPEDVDEYAQKVLESRVKTNLPPPDESLGSYVTSSLRSAGEDYESIKDIPDYESLVELVQEHCACTEKEAIESLDTIGHAVRTNKIPWRSIEGGSASSLLDSLANVTDNAKRPVPELLEDNPQQSMFVHGDTYGTPIEEKKTTLASPLHADDLIPVDLLGALDDPATPRVGRNLSASISESSAHSPTQTYSMSNSAADENAFPPLGALSTESSTSNKKKAPKRSSGVKTHEAKDLASTLFVPASRSRQSSIDEAFSAQQASPTHVPIQPDSTLSNVSEGAGLGDFYLEEQQYGTATEILLSMNVDVSEEAAMAASQMAQADVNVAQFLIDSVLNAPPICRHFLQNGCYRSDCQFSHDIGGSTCMFWLRGRCGKGPTCRFLHGFNPRLLEGLAQQQQEYQQADFPSLGSQTTAKTSYQAPTQGSSTNKSSKHHTPSLLALGGTPSVWSSNHSVPKKLASSTFANVASQGYSSKSPQFTDQSTNSRLNARTKYKPKKVDIPQELWSAHENRDASAFYIADPMERYRVVSEQSAGPRRENVVDLHFQSTKTFSHVLSNVLPLKFERHGQVWIVTGTGHHVGSRTHQKGGGALETAVISWLNEQGYEYAMGRDRNGLSGILLVYRPE